MLTFDVLGKCHCIDRLWIDEAKSWKWSDFSWKQTFFSQKPVVACLPSKYQSTLLSSLKQRRSVNCCACFLATQCWLPENVNNCISIWKVLKFKFEFFEMSRWISDNDVWVSKFAIVEHRWITQFRETFLKFETSRTEKVRERERERESKRIRFFRRINFFVIQSYWLHFFY